MLRRFLLWLSKWIHEWSRALIRRFEPSPRRFGESASAPPAHWAALVRDRAPELLRPAAASSAIFAAARSPVRQHPMPTTGAARTRALSIMERAGRQSVAAQNVEQTRAVRQVEDLRERSAAINNKGVKARVETARPSSVRATELAATRESTKIFDQPAAAPGLEKQPQFESPSLAWPRLASSIAGEVCNQPELEWPRLNATAAAIQSYRPGNLLDPTHRSRIDAEQRDSRWSA